MKFNFKCKDILFLDTMITPIIITVLYWISLVSTVVFGLIAIFRGAFFSGLLMIILGVIFVRLWSEFVVLIFKIYATLQTIAANTSKLPTNPTQQQVNNTVAQPIPTVTPGESSSISE